MTIPVPEIAPSDWISVTRLPYAVARVGVRPVDGKLMVRTEGSGEPWAGDWGEVAADGVFAPKAGPGYMLMASHDGPAATVHLQTNMVHGVMAVHAFYRFTDGSGRRDYYTREFYVPASGDEQPASAATGTLPDFLRGGVNVPDGLLGSWHALDREGRQIDRMEFALDGGVPVVRAFGAVPGGTADWGSAPATLYADAAYPDGPPAFLATFDLDDRSVHVQARDFLGVLVVAEYTEYTDGSGRRDHFVRDCFRHEPA